MFIHLFSPAPTRRSRPLLQTAKIVMVVPEQEEGVRELWRKIRNGELTRNKHFELFQQPDVRAANVRLLRLQALLRLLRDHQPSELEVAFSAPQDRADTWLLTCNSRKWNLRWSAHLNRHELNFLAEEAPGWRIFSNPPSRPAIG